MKILFVLLSFSLMFISTSFAMENDIGGWHCGDVWGFGGGAFLFTTPLTVEEINAAIKEQETYEGSNESEKQ